MEEERDEEQEEGERPKKIRTDSKPSKEEVEEHMLTHMPYRSWCEHCVKGKAKGKPHARANREEGETPVVSIDYMFMSDNQEQEEERGMPILVMKDRDTKMIKARVVPRKGGDSYAIQRLVKDL